MGAACFAQTSSVPASPKLVPATVSGSPAPEQPLPDTRTLLFDVERNQKRLEQLRRDYTYHVRMVSETLEKSGGVKKVETTDAESLTVDGIRVDRTVARNGKPLSPEEQARESERIDKEVAKGKERRARAQDRQKETDAHGDAVLSLSRILELGSFTNPRRVVEDGRPTIVLDYKGNPDAKTHSPFETAFKDLQGKVWIDEGDRVVVRGQGELVNDFKLGGGLLADVHKGTNFEFRAHRVAEGVWLPATIDATGHLRVLLFANVNGREHLETSDYRRFHTSATIVGSHGVIGPDGQPLPDSGQPPAAPPPPALPRVEPQL